MSTGHEPTVSTPDKIGAGVGPVLRATPLAAAVIEAIEWENEGVVVQDEGTYLRVLSPGVCRLSRDAVERVTGDAFRFPGDLEVIMSSFAGLVRMTEDGAVWWLAAEAPPDPPVPSSAGA